MANVYAHSRTEDEFDEPDYSASQSGYAVRTYEDAPYADTFGWAPTLRLGATEIPDASRLGMQTRRDMRPDPSRPPEDHYNALEAEERGRHNVEHIDRMLSEVKSGPGYINPAMGANRWARNPRETPPPENRVTQVMHPVMYFFTRPFDQRFARKFTGIHFSMADHRRTYDVLGMAPAKTRRNTFRLEPAPWDTDLVDMPAPDVAPNIAPVPGIAALRSNGGGSWRLT